MKLTQKIYILTHNGGFFLSQPKTNPQNLFIRETGEEDIGPSTKARKQHFQMRFNFVYYKGGVAATFWAL